MTIKDKLKSVPVEDNLFSELSNEDFQYNKIMGKIAGRIILERTKQHISQEELAEKLGVKQSLISKWESGDNNFTFRQIVKIFSALGVDVDITFGDEKESLGSYYETLSTHWERHQTLHFKFDKGLYESVESVLHNVKSKKVGEIA